ncbi:MAG TPA: hypothetical protein VJ777_16120, partial [Mycobacterium sp.]|nr:hypothetical protein [Mycobacterium sp.]
LIFVIPVHPYQRDTSPFGEELGTANETDTISRVGPISEVAELQEDVASVLDCLVEQNFEPRFVAVDVTGKQDCRLFGVRKR